MNQVHLPTLRLLNHPIINKLKIWKSTSTILSYNTSKNYFLASYQRNYHGCVNIHTTKSPHKSNKSLPQLVRYSSTIFIPEAPVAPVRIDDGVLGSLEPTFASLGLANWTPTGFVQSWFEYLHISLDLPWWSVITITTVIMRFMLFPLVIKLQRHAAKLNNNLPVVQALSLKMSEARQSGDHLASARYSHEMMEFMKKKDISPSKTLVGPLIQIPVFLSMFTALRGMANCPVESLSTGGLFWFSDLTVTDPYYLLPLITSATLMLTIKVGSDTGNIQMQTNPMIKYLMYGIPIITFPFVMNFPAALPLYWMTSNIISLLTVAILRIDVIRKFFKIEKRIQHQPENLPVKQKGFVDGVTDAWTNMKVTNELAHRRSLDEMEFKKAGLGPIERTYKHNPTIQKK